MVRVFWHTVSTVHGSERGSHEWKRRERLSVIRAHRAAADDSESASVIIALAASVIKTKTLCGVCVFGQ